jgi:hypothetical protein
MRRRQCDEKLHVRQSLGDYSTTVGGAAPQRLVLLLLQGRRGDSAAMALV